MKKPDLEAVHRGLKDFQRTTVDYVFERLYLASDGSKRLLCADEVGLGKTLVARGVIARAIEHLWDKPEVKRIDIIYICSNADIARQNISRLNVTGQEDFALASRITMLPVMIKDLKGKRLNFISFTPSTSFDLKNNLGTQKERTLLYWLLRDAWQLQGAAPLNVFQGTASREGFRQRIDSFQDQHEIDTGLKDAFTNAIALDARVAAAEGRPDLKVRFDDLCMRFGRSKMNVPKDDRRDRMALIGDLRILLAVTCLEALEPDLIILDEFQRFKHLLEGTDQAGELAQKLFEFEDNRLLLLSATPYKMYTLEEEAETDDHYKDFLTTLAFLQRDKVSTEAFAALLRDYRREIFALDQGGHERLALYKARIEDALRLVMVRTERLAVSNDRNGMLAQIPTPSAGLRPRDVADYLALQQVANLLDSGDTLDYWKSAPYLLNFMDEYALKEAFCEAVDGEQSPALAAILEAAPDLLLSSADIDRYESVEPGNAQLRWLTADTLSKGLWKLLWMPPSLPYYTLEGAFGDFRAMPPTKRLVFSSWRVVPKAISSLLSYEAERQMFRSIDEAPENSREARKKRKGLLRFARADGRLTGMPVLGMLYPSVTMAKACDPLSPSIRGDSLATLAEAVTRAETQVTRLLERVHAELQGRSFEQRPDESRDAWYWAAPILFDCLDDSLAPRDWLRRDDCAARWSGEETASEDDGEPSAWEEHVEMARQLVKGHKRLALGPPPADLARTLAWIGIAGPGVVALRALGRVAEGGSFYNSTEIRDAAGSLAWALRGLFNLPEVMALIRGLDPGEPYWLRVVEYCAKGGLQPVLDEYAHVLKESLGLIDAQPEEVAQAVAAAMREALGLRTAALSVDMISSADARVTVETHRMRARFALRFGEEDSDDGVGSNRAEQVRTAFNSPFWPFVLATTSVGQEGLDFHQFCHAVVHWNLPANPVDLEQREGRVHRYKGHAVRKNVATQYGLKVVSEHPSDPWEALFAAAKRDRVGDSDIVPYWVFPLEGGARIERHVPALPLSREQHRLSQLRRALALYRMVFGQARQEELLSYLMTRLPENAVAAAGERLRIDLSPRIQPSVFAEGRAN